MKLFSTLKVLVVTVAIALPVSALAQSIDEAIGALAEKLGAQLSEEGTERLAIYGFSDLNGFESALGDFISEELTTSLFGAGNFAIVERNEFERVLSEHERYSSDIFNSETIAELGEFLAIQALITGSVTQFEDSIRINARAIDVATARVFAAASTSVARDGMVNTLINQRSRSDSSVLAAVPGSIAQPSSVVYQNSNFKVVPASVRLWDAGNGVSITVEITNVSAKTFYLAGHDRADPYATTKHGDTFDVRMDGLSTSRSGAEWVQLRPGETLTAVYKIGKKNRKEILGNVLSLRSGLRVSSTNSGTSIEEANFNLDKIVIK